ncbi:fibronectin type III domain-containing protein [Candidatus Poriferisodalis sp.]|uniref:fibronectin type III domain-containing protein n=1 Tax=Candidatus Poriferisodalis sp. TaxID=3101277 RepID=UPI003B0236AE
MLMLSTALTLTAQPAAAQTPSWSATLAAQTLDNGAGCLNGTTDAECSDTDNLSEDDFTLGGNAWSITQIVYRSAHNDIVVSFNRSVATALDSYKFCVGATAHAFSSATHPFNDETAEFDTTASWSGGRGAVLSIVASGASCPQPVSIGRQGSMSVDGFHPMGPGRMKIAEGASITYGIVLHQPPTADLIIAPRHHNVRPDGSDYPNVDNGLLTIHNSVTWKAAPHPNYLSGDWQRSKSVRLTAVDDNVCKSPPGTRYWIRHHGIGGGPDWGGWDRQDRHHGLVVSIEIIDDDCRFLAPSPGSVWLEEGASATYTVRLKTPLEDAAYISPRVSAAGDSDIDAITVSPERIWVEAGDTSPKTFTVSAGKDADSRAEVLHVDHSVDSPEVPPDYLGARVTVVVMDEQSAQNAARHQERDPLTVTGLALTAGSGVVALSPAFSTDVTSYRAEVPAGTTSVTLAPHWSGGESVHAGSRQGATTFTRPARVRPSGTTVDLALAPDGGATELYVMVSGSGGTTTYSIEVTEARPEPKIVTVPDDDAPEPQQQQQPQQQIPEQQQPEQQQQTADPVETPGPVVGLQLTAKRNKVIVTWEAPASGDTPDRYIAHIKNTDTGKGKNRNIAAGKTTTTFGNLTPGATYRVWVRAQNEAGKGERIHARITLPTEAE